jgi:hypothetical protein
MAEGATKGGDRSGGAGVLVETAREIRAGALALVAGIGNADGPPRGMSRQRSRSKSKRAASYPVRAIVQGRLTM